MTSPPPPTPLFHLFRLSYRPDWSVLGWERQRQPYPSPCNVLRLNFRSFWELGVIFKRNTRTSCASRRKGEREEATTRMAGEALIRWGEGVCVCGFIGELLFP